MYCRCRPFIGLQLLLFVVTVVVILTMLNIRGKSEVSGLSTLSRTTPGKPWFKFIIAVAVFRVVVIVDVKSMPALYYFGSQYC